MSDAPPQLDPTKVQALVANAHGDLDVVRSLLECVVFGRRAGKAAAERARS